MGLVANPSLLNEFLISSPKEDNMPWELEPSP
eukprot:CAMPEP_0184455660 /NCGR_PEP_ID=MMETSP0740-20130409/24147_1 /TAXON_ID=385413 /ORGANISM="Thalassiosira miniscula, Strain CCMP1093" /LENGTH=31 /DNA_ID= /DNA_START= /DNA_END= /DNA_ORIENTATION=